MKQSRGGAVPLKVVHLGKETVVEDGATALIGSDASSAIRIVRPGISRRHALVSYDGTAWKVEDAGSRNGTFIDGNRVSVSMIDGSTTAYLGHPTDGEQVTFIPQDAERTGTAASSDAVLEEFDLPATPPPAATAVAGTAAAKSTKKQSRTTSASAPTRVQPSAPAAAPPRASAASSASDVELAQLTSAIRDQVKAVKGLTWSVWAMIAVTAALIVLTLFVGILSN